MKVYFALFFGLLLSYSTYAQISYTYDTNGNRVRRIPPPPDLIPLLNVTPSTTYGTTPITTFVSVYDIEAVPTAGLITVYITKDPILSFTFDPVATLVGGTAVQNANWSFDATNPNFYILTSTTVIAGGAFSKIGLAGVITPGNTKGQVNVGVAIVGGSGGETNIVNNSAAARIDYFNH
ncbi:hypothetical protein [Spirosoma jeollabukense]